MQPLALRLLGRSRDRMALDATSQLPVLASGSG